MEQFEDLRVSSPLSGQLSNYQMTMNVCVHQLEAHSIWPTKFFFGAHQGADVSSQRCHAVVVNYRRQGTRALSKQVCSLGCHVEKSTESLSSLDTGRAIFSIYSDGFVLPVAYRFAPILILCSR